MMRKITLALLVALHLVCGLAAALPSSATELECPAGQHEVQTRVSTGSKRGGSTIGVKVVTKCVATQIDGQEGYDSNANSDAVNDPCLMDPTSGACLEAIETQFEYQDRCENAREAGEIGEDLEIYCGATTDGGDAVSIEQIVETAIGSLELPAPALEFGPDKDLVAVKYPVWLWIENGADRSASVPLGAFVVTATATLKSVTWDMGEPIDVAKPWIKPAPMVCNGPGTAPPPSVNELEMPDCGYIFNWKSLPERTDGVGAWTVTVTANWEVTIASNSGYTDVIEVPTTNSDTVVVGEWNVVIVPGPGG